MHWIPSNDRPDVSLCDDHAETIAEFLLEGIPLTWGRIDHTLASLHELMQISMEPFDAQPTGEVASHILDQLQPGRSKQSVYP